MQNSFASTLTNFETWFEIVPPSTDVMAMTTAHLQTYHEKSDACQQAIVLISRVVWGLATLFFDENNNASSEAQITRHNLIVDLAEVGFWTSSRGLDWTMLFPSVVSITKTNPTTFKEVEGRSRYTELCRDTARGLFRLFEASCYHPDIRCLKACVRSPHTIRYLLSHECTRRDTALCLCQALSRLGEVMVSEKNHRSSSSNSNKDGSRKRRLSRRSGSANNQQHARSSSSGATTTNNNKNGKNINNNNNNDADHLFSPDRVMMMNNSSSAGGPVAGAVVLQQQQSNGSSGILRRSTSGANLGSSQTLFSSTTHNNSNNNNNNHSNNNENNNSNMENGSSLFTSSSTATGPQEIILTAQALRTLLPHFLDEAALAVAADPSSDPDHITLDIVCDAFLRITAGSNEMFAQIVSSTVFLRKLSMGLPPNRIANHAVAMLTRFAVTFESVDEILRLVPLTTWLSLCSNITISYARCAEIMEILARLRFDKKTAETLIKENPVVAYALNRPIDSSCYYNNNDAPARLMNAVRLLCTDPALGTSYSSSSSIRDGALNRLREAAKYKRYGEAVAAIDLLGILFTFSPNPDFFTNSDELLRLLLKFVKAPMNPMNKEAIKHASRFFNTICAVASF